MLMLMLMLMLASDVTNADAARADQELDNLMQTRQLLQGEYQRDFDTVLADVFEQVTELGRQRQQQASLPLTLPVVRAHRIKPIPTRGETQILELRRKQRQEA